MEDPGGSPSPATQHWPARQWPALVAMGVGLVLCVAGMHIVRLDYGPDEPDHMQYIHILAREHRLPTPADTHSVQHPPLYFLLMVPPYLLGGSEVAPFSLQAGPQRLAEMTPGEKRSRYLCRYTQVLLAVLSLWLIGAVARELLPGRRKAHTAVLAGLAAWPLFVYVGSVVNNDMLALLWSAVAALCALRWLRAERWGDLRLGAALGVVLGLGLWMKLTTVYCLPVVILLVWLQQGSWGRRLRFAVACVAATLAVGCWWYVRSFLAYGEAFPNFAGGMGEEAHVRALVLYDPLGQGLRFVGEAITRIARASMLPEFLWGLGGGLGGLTSLSVVRGLVLVTAAVYLIYAASRGRMPPARVSGRIAWPAALALALACAMVIQYAVTRDLRGLTSGGRYVLAASVWAAMLLLGAGERVAALLPSRATRTSVLATVLCLSAIGAAAFVAVLVRWYGAIG